MNDTPETTTDKPWQVRLVCCGKDDGTCRFATRGEAEVFRSQYTADNGPGSHDRAAIITGPADQEQNIGAILAEYLEAMRSDKGMRAIVDDCIALTAALRTNLATAVHARDAIKGGFVEVCAERDQIGRDRDDWRNRAEGALDEAGALQAEILKALAAHDKLTRRATTTEAALRERIAADCTLRASYYDHPEIWQPDSQSPDAIGARAMRQAWATAARLIRSGEIPADDLAAQPPQDGPRASAEVERCAHCGKPLNGFALIGDAKVCHTGTLPSYTHPTDCYRLVLAGELLGSRDLRTFRDKLADKLIDAYRAAQNASRDREPTAPPACADCELPETNCACG